MKKFEVWYNQRLFVVFRNGDGSVEWSEFSHLAPLTLSKPAIDAAVSHYSNYSLYSFQFKEVSSENEKV